MKKSRHSFSSSLPLLVGAGLTLLMLWSCGGGTSPQPPAVTTGSATTTITDPPSCTATFDHVYVTITRVRAHISPDADSNGSGWVDLVDLQSSPKQIDLLSLASNTCLLTTLGSTSGLPAGKYQQIRLYLLANNASSGPSPNACEPASGFNCVVPAGGSPQVLLLSSEAQTGIKIPPGQIAGGGVTIQAGQSTDINIDFDSCASIVRQGNGGFRLKPTLHAGEVELSNNSISGKVVDSSNNNAPVAGAIVLLEQPDSNGVDRVVHEGLTGSDGSFIFCPLPNPDGTTTYDVVVAAQTTSAQLIITTTYNATIAFKVPVGTSLTSIPLVPESSSLTGSPGATIAAQVTTADTNVGVAVPVTLMAVQQAVPTGGSALQVTIPVFGAISQPPNVMTTATPDTGPACPANTDCFNYSLVVPASNPQVGTFSSGSITYTAPAPDPVSYSLIGEAPNCTGVTPTAGTISSITVTSGGTANVSTVLAFSGCAAL